MVLPRDKQTFVFFNSVFLKILYLYDSIFYPLPFRKKASKVTLNKIGRNPFSGKKYKKYGCLKNTNAFGQFLFLNFYSIWVLPHRFAWSETFGA